MDLFTLFDLTFKSDVKITVTIGFHVYNYSYNMCHTAFT